ncbi:unnamed protein product [Scytosiphon promiscuus]
MCLLPYRISLFVRKSTSSSAADSPTLFCFRGYVDRRQERRICLPRFLLFIVTIKVPSLIEEHREDEEDLERIDVILSAGFLLNRRARQSKEDKHDGLLTYASIAELQSAHKVDRGCDDESKVILHEAKKKRSPRWWRCACASVGNGTPFYPSQVGRDDVMVWPRV